MELLNAIKEQARRINRCVVLPEGVEQRTLKAADIILSEGLARLILLGNPNKISRLSKELNLKNIDKAVIVDPLSHKKKDLYTGMLYELRKHKGITEEEAAELIEDPLYLATLIIKNGDADGEVAGAINATGDVLRPAFQIIKTLPGAKVVSGSFIMIVKDKTYGDDGIIFFSDCAVNPVPTASELAEIAISTAQTAQTIAGIKPNVAMLSFSTKGSAHHSVCSKIIEATRIAKEREPELLIDGELQADAALVEKVGISKAPGSPVAGKANVLIFPSLEAGNIAYKLVQRLAGAEAIGPILQGLAAPINDLSRGCSVEDIVNLVAITATQANENK